MDLELDIVHLRTHPNQLCASNRSLRGNATHKERQIAGRDVVDIVPLERHQGIVTAFGHYWNVSIFWEERERRRGGRRGRKRGLRVGDGACGNLCFLCPTEQHVYQHVVDVLRIIPEWKEVLG